MENKAIKVENLTFRYPDAESDTLKNISFELDYGEVLGIIGPNGAGKTTLAMALKGLIPHTVDGEIQGKIIVDGKDVLKHDISEQVLNSGLVFQDPEGQLSQMSVEEEVAFGLGNIGVPRAEMVKRIEKALQTVGLAGFEKRSPLALSGGQQQRLAIASVMAMEPSIMMMDEPTTMLDPVGKNEVFKVLKSLKEKGMTGVIIEHEIERLTMYCDKILVLHEGESILFGTPKEIFSDLMLLKKFKLRGPQVTEVAYEVFNDKEQIPVVLDEAVQSFSKELKA
ncbi:energy-coupling factor ABC transporter ATP-binding protein [Aquibacillus albus]|uniref:Energy-coupling factor transport system ATP-binding protein n=1 Tax=Aquibacillus albus TaxID=1168171 RepID=A0ABS2MY50_9BACI|nr:ATP-binding cassette domain-containing protein [Aquibacillus albus]MBM7570723.1 energy-coupling factor transport system ATP-binding protein [Aquibacillus albus]